MSMYFFFFFHHKNLKFFKEKPRWGSRGSGLGPGGGPAEWQGPVGRLQPRLGVARPLLVGCLELGRSL